MSQSWTFTHLYYPDPNDNEGGVEGFIIKAMSLPSNMGSQRKQSYFSMFYSTTAVFAFMDSVIYWFITRQQEAGGGAEGLLEALAAMSSDFVTTANASTMVSLPKAPCMVLPS